MTLKLKHHKIIQWKVFLPKPVKYEVSKQLYFLLYLIHILDMHKPKTGTCVLENSFP